MPTRDRRPFVGQAIRYFLRQNYERRELIVVDDGRDEIGDLLPDDERVRHVRLRERTTLGAKRNIACELAQGGLITHWDDDDWSSPTRLSLQVAELERTGADVCGAREVLHYRLEAGEAWLYRARQNGRPWLAGGTLMYRRATWKSHPFPGVNVGEDAAFLHALPADRVRSLADSSFYVALLHRENTAAKNLADARWQRRPMHEVDRRFGEDRWFYLQMRNGGRRRSHATPSRVASVTVGAPFMVYDGYGSMAEYLVCGMSRAGARVDVVPFDLDRDGLSDEFLELLERSCPQPSAPALYFCWPRPDLERFRFARELFVNTMWETDTLPGGWARRLNRARTVIVPTRFVADTCRRSGVTAPIEVVPEGIDPAVYHHVERPEREGLTSLVIGTRVDRKNMDVAIAAWKRAFEGDRRARLIVKARYGYTNLDPHDARIIVVDENETTRGIAHWYRRADVLLALGNEGFGLPLIEGMATGLPVIALDSEGQSDTCRDAGERVLTVPPAQWRAYDEPVFGRCGKRGVPEVEAVADRLRWVDRNRAEARALGRAAAEWAPRHRNVWSKAPSVLDVMEARLPAGRPLRRARTLWVPSWGTQCGIAEYTAALAASLRDVRVSARAPAPRNVRLLHAQHEPSLLADAEIGAPIADAAASGVPVVVTEHVVLASGHPWERHARALVATTAAGAERLRGRCPKQHVEHIPIGSPTWFPARKPRRGRVIGAFGFLERHKGFWRLLDALRELPGTELVMYSHARSAQTARAFDDAAAGLPVRRVGDYLPAGEVARRLAAEADVLAFWYDEARHPVASAAVRHGLATGVPVLASPTGWFADVREATYQPPDLVAGLARLLEDSALRRDLERGARELCERTAWPRIAAAHSELWTTIDAN